MSEYSSSIWLSNRKYRDAKYSIIYFLEIKSPKNRISLVTLKVINHTFISVYN
jgi:hypothetical protein